MNFAFKPVLMAALLAAGVVSGSHAGGGNSGECAQVGVGV